MSRAPKPRLRPTRLAAGCWALTAFAAAAAPTQEPPPADSEIVVTGHKGSLRAGPDAAEVIRTHCFDPARRTGRPTPPTGDGRWIPLEPAARRQFRIADPETPAFSLTDGVREQELWLKIERIEQAPGLIEHRCTVAVIGGRNHQRLVGEMTGLFKGTPTQRHVGQPDGSPAAPGWEQWLWTGMPQRGSARWRSIAQPRGAGRTWVVVSDPSFFDRHDYIMGDLKVRKAGPTPLSLVTFSVTRRKRS